LGRFFGSPPSEPPGFFWFEGFDEGLGFEEPGLRAEELGPFDGVPWRFARSVSARSIIEAMNPFFGVAPALPLVLAFATRVSSVGRDRRMKYC
jgi:hypothetical protein